MPAPWSKAWIKEKWFATCEKLSLKPDSEAVLRLQQNNNRGLVIGGIKIPVGRILLTTASVAGLGTVCYYGLGMGNEERIIDRMNMWSGTTWLRLGGMKIYVAGSLLITAATAVAMSKNETLMYYISQGEWSLFGTVLLWASGVVCQSIPYDDGFQNTLKKHLVWFLHCGIMGGVIIAPLRLNILPPILIDALKSTVLVSSALTVVALTTPKELFLRLDNIPNRDRGVERTMTFTMLTGTWFLPTTEKDDVMFYIFIYSGLGLFGLFMMQDIQRCVKIAETQQAFVFDPINNGFSFVGDFISIYTRIAMLIAAG